MEPQLPRRAIFIDVENTSREEALFESLEALAIDRKTQRTELTAVGNWRTVGQQVGRRLGALGAQLVHSAPARGVRDWSDLWIAVAAGYWLAQAIPGDVLDIVSNDRAFDAVGDLAASRGVVFQRVPHRRGAHTPARPSDAAPRRRTRGGRRRAGGHAQSSSAPVAATSGAARPSPRNTSAVEVPHGATRDQIIAVIGRLTHAEAGRWVNVDILEKSLKAEGFSRPAGSPRLVTRLRMLRDVEVDAHGRVRLVV